MNNIISEELKVIPIFLLSGAFIGISFDIFRIIRKSFKISNLHTNIEDILFGIILFTILIKAVLFLEKTVGAFRGAFADLFSLRRLSR